jgi:hypothetical protein
MGIPTGPLHSSRSRARGATHATTEATTTKSRIYFSVFKSVPFGGGGERAIPHGAFSSRYARSESVKRGYSADSLRVKTSMILEPSAVGKPPRMSGLPGLRLAVVVSSGRPPWKSAIDRLFWPPLQFIS